MRTHIFPTNPLYILHPINLGREPTNQTSEYTIKRAFQQAGEVKCRKKFILAQIEINQPCDIIAYLALLQPAALYNYCEIYALLLDPASSAEDA